MIRPGRAGCDLAETVGEFRIPRRVVCGISTEDEERLDLARFHVHAERAHVRGVILLEEIDHR